MRKTCLLSILLVIHYWSWRLNTFKLFKPHFTRHFTVTLPPKKSPVCVNRWIRVKKLFLQVLVQLLLGVFTRLQVNPPCQDAASSLRLLPVWSDSLLQNARRSAGSDWRVAAVWGAAVCDDADRYILTAGGPVRVAVPGREAALGSTFKLKLLRFSQVFCVLFLRSINQNQGLVFSFSSSPDLTNHTWWGAEGQRLNSCCFSVDPVRIKLTGLIFNVFSGNLNLQKWEKNLYFESLHNEFCWYCKMF